MTLDTRAPLEIWRHADLKSRSSGTVLVLPERAIRIGGSGAEILRLVAGGHSGEEIVTIMQDRYPETAGIRDEVIRFLEEMRELGGIVLRNESVGQSS